MTATGTAGETVELDDLQGLLARGYGKLPEATYLLLSVERPAAARTALRQLARSVTTADVSPEESALNLALTAPGVLALTESGRLHPGFAEPFARGMTDPYRSRILGDVAEDAPEGWVWGGPGTSPVHVMALLYARSPAALLALTERVEQQLVAGGLQVLRRLHTDPLSDREPFGFRDGLSQPAIAGLGPGTDQADGPAGPVLTGEFVLGYRNEYGQRTYRPLLQPADDRGGLLPKDADGSGAPDLGRNGSYLVLRQLAQDVDGFHRYLDRAAGVADGSVDPDRRALLAAKIVGRWPDGAPVTLAPTHDDPALADANDFGYHAQDPYGDRCPLGSHIRRSNPRDSLEPHPGTAQSVEVNRKHRLLRRGRNYSTADGERGVLFLCLGANLARQYEFIQHSWVNDPAFNGLTDSTDPLVGVRHDGGATFTEPGLPLRRRHRELPQFVHVRGGAYFFLPGIRALGYLLREPADQNDPEERTRPMAHEAYHTGPGWRAFRAAARQLDRRRGWDHLPRPLGLATLIGLRDNLRVNNLVDTGELPAVDPPPLRDRVPADLTSRSVDGSYNDLGRPRAGMAGTRFGRNVRLESVTTPSRTDVLEPSPRRISQELLTRTELIAATSVNALVAPWLQWMIRDWFSHGQGVKDDPWEVELAADDPWPHHPMSIPRTMPDPTRPAGSTAAPTSVNTCTHWWDASQIYGTMPEYQRAVRTGVQGTLRVEPDGSLPVPQGEGGPTSEPGFWSGLLMLQTVFTREHNAVCAALHEAYPAYGDEELFQRARLVIAALIAKIHTTEWTPAVISHPTTVTGMRANWWGLAGERTAKAFGRISSSEVVSGIPGTGTNSYGVPFSLTEEFAAVYRMHELVPDLYDLRAVSDDHRHRSEPTTLREMSGSGGVKIVESFAMSDLLYTFGTEHPGVVTLHNFPRFLQEFERPDGVLMDLATVDILRHRELGVARYCEFRRQLDLPAPAGFEDLSDDPETVERIRELYDGDLEKVDLLVGLLAERLPKGFAFSDTAFRIFIVMASRRLNSDRFLTDDFRPEVYTEAGMRWVSDNTMLTVLLRHYPELRPSLRGVANAFQPWHRAGAPTPDPHP
ncbi:MAG: heme peroxidase [Frankiales bacterium]|nr:heme peroxidase [Frankiales bacterium]